MPGALDAAPTGAATAESAPIVHASQPQTSPERIQDRLAQATLVLRSGESLWSLTGQLLGPHASAAEIARSWPLLWEANADQIRDPDQVAAGTVLQVPPQLLPEQ
ncbi:LysM peptidoglycan-binding domain-containing protein [Kocuria palustris]|uniref:LysM peptidoglycan-binding domain-containing protein n=1 Tax=Kocuria palustris TaxID=71999 RepID=UPI00246858DD|nr:LysM peptidoglycan-binding domain-containing protein [Kocuria palustris]MDH5151153.1 LysM peptidoglycan-binding domain-containing protein [Kocuria palustris]